MTLQDKLDEITAQTRNLVQPERLELSERAIAELFASGIEEKLALRICWHWDRLSCAFFAGDGVHIA